MRVFYCLLFAGIVKKSNVKDDWKEFMIWHTQVCPNIFQMPVFDNKEEAPKVSYTNYDP